MIGAEMTCRASKAFDLQYEFSFLFMSSPFVSTGNKVLVRSATHTMSWTTRCYRSTARAETMRGQFILACCRVRGGSRGLHSGQGILVSFWRRGDPGTWSPISCLSLIFWRFGEVLMWGMQVLRTVKNWSARVRIWWHVIRAIHGYSARNQPWDSILRGKIGELYDRLHIMVAQRNIHRACTAMHVSTNDHNSCFWYNKRI